MSSALPSTPSDQRRVPTAPATINLSAGSVETVMVDGQPHIVFRPAVEAIGLDYSTQLRKLRDRSWANRRDIPTVAEDGKTRQMAAVDVPTFLMWLATVNEAKVAAEVRPTLIAYQRETTTAVNDYWTMGGAINPTATLDQVDHLRTQLDGVERARIAQERLSAMGVAKQFGLVNSSYVEAMARTELARMNGEEPDVDPQDITITCDEYLKEAGVSSAADLRSARVKLGRTVAALYRARYGNAPQKIKRPIDGVFRDVAVYTMRDRDLFDTAWQELGRHYDLQTSINGVAR
ncbi:phage antirepressor N-terminal domain-containing protein [Streptomyces sp. TRM68416]|uniref:phage antirepressor N-terminal domain-containing protein n=1 Tax=Streptomyces sp. TRM68416 TaxID=2758412 RepID=UPI00166190DC|nr:phage antirepressor N-terminal domain-containing protein [Streptomyces sp. TRM68416]MBD0838822.1 phage antirepressor [Streptomyces sp. TRM68416]